ncbi:MAG: ABC transporter substrate-binding protein [Deltaproteobacteria bacterium]
MKRILALSALLAASCAHAPPRSEERGLGAPGAGPRVAPSEVEASDAAQALAQADALRAQGEHARAAQAYRALASRYPDAPAAARALWRLGGEEEAKQELPAARTAYSDLLVRFPLDPRADEAKRRLAQIDLSLQRYRDAEQSLKSLYERTPSAEKPAADRALAKAAEGAGDQLEAIRAWVRLEREEPSSKPEAELALASIVDTRLPALDIARALDELPGDSPVVPELSAKRALVLEHLGDPNAPEALSEFLARYPGSTFAPRVKERLEELTRARTVVQGAVGILLPKTPDRYTAYATAALQGLELGLGDGVKLFVEDSQGDPAATTAAVWRLAAKGVQVIVGPILSGESVAAATAAEHLGIPIVTLARTEGLTRLGPYVFRSMLTDSAQAHAIVHYAADIRGMKRFAVLYPEVEYGKQMMNLFWDDVDRAGGQMRGAESYPFDATTFKPFTERLVGRHDLELRQDWLDGVKDIDQQKLPLVKKRRALRQLREGLPPVIDFDGLFIADSAKAVSLIAPQLAVENVITNGCDAGEMRRIRDTTGEDKPATVELLGWTAWYDPDFDLVQRAGKYVECAVFVDGFFEGSRRPATHDFVTAFGKAYGHAPGLMEAEAYDAGRMVSQLLAAKPPTRDAFRDGLAALKGFAGATGDTTIGPDREPQKELFYLTITPQGYEELDLSKVKPLANPGS